MRRILNKYFYFVREPDGENLLEPRYAYMYTEYVMANLGWGSNEGKSYLRKRLYNLWTAIYLAFALYVPIIFVLSLMWTIDLSHANTLFFMLEVFFNAPAYAIKSIIMYRNTWRVKKAKELLDVMYERSGATYEERVEVHRVVARCNFIIVLYHILYFIPTTLNLISSLCNGIVPLNLYNPFIDWHDGTASLVIASVLEYILQMSAIYACVALDGAPLVFALTVRAHIKWLRERVRRLRNNASMSEDENYQELVLCIKDHKLIIEYCDNMRPLISRTMFVQFLVVSLVLASALLHLIFFADLYTGISTFIYMTATLFQTFPFSFTCDLIGKDCESLALEIFHSNWVGASRPYTSALRNYLHNVQQPIIFLGGGFFPICLNTNLQVAKFAFSLMTFVQHTSIFDNFDK